MFATTRTSGGGVTVHSCTAPEEGWSTTYHLIETGAGVVLVDAPLTAALTHHLIAYAKSLGKPLTRLLLTHAHPDHFAGAALLGVPVHALAATAQRIAAAGPAQIRGAYQLTGTSGEVPPPVSDIRVLEPGTEEIDGVVFDYSAVDDAETASQLVIALPGADMLLPGDLIYHGVHPFLAERHFAGWTAALDRLDARPYRHVLPGHGAPGGWDLVQATRDYLTFAGQAYADAPDPAGFAKALDERFPGYGGTRMRPLQNYYLFPVTGGA